MPGVSEILDLECILRYGICMYFIKALKNLAINFDTELNVLNIFDYLKCNCPVFWITHF